MSASLEILRMAHGLALHASQRQAVIAGNVANADTPGYRARDIAPFSSTYRAEGAGAPLRATRAGHHADRPPGPGAARLVDAPGPSAPNGNTVALETEMMKATKIRHQQDIALSVYRSTLTVLRASLGRGR